MKVGEEGNGRVLVLASGEGSAVGLGCSGFSEVAVQQMYL